MENNIRSLRKKRGLTLESLAERVETTAAQIQKLETGERQLTQAWMIRLAPALGCAPTDLMSDLSDAGEDSGDLMDRAILEQCVEALENEAARQNKKFTAKQYVKMALELYDMFEEDQKAGIHIISPSNVKRMVKEGS